MEAVSRLSQVDRDGIGDKVRDESHLETLAFTEHEVEILDRTETDVDSLAGVRPGLQVGTEELVPLRVANGARRGRIAEVTHEARGVGGFAPDAETCFPQDAEHLGVLVEEGALSPSDERGETWLSVVAAHSEIPQAGRPAESRPARARSSGKPFGSVEEGGEGRRDVVAVLVARAVPIPVRHEKVGGPGCKTEED